MLDEVYRTITTSPNDITAYIAWAAIIGGAIGATITRYTTKASHLPYTAQLRDFNNDGRLELATYNEHGHLINSMTTVPNTNESVFASTRSLDQLIRAQTHVVHDQK